MAFTAFCEVHRKGCKIITVYFTAMTEYNAVLGLELKLENEYQEYGKFKIKVIEEKSKEVSINRN